MPTAQAPTKPLQNVKIPDRSPPLFLRIVVTLLLMAFLFGISIAISLYTKELNAPAPTNFAECSTAKGSVIQESYPEVCVTKKGQRFVKEISEEEKKLLEPPVVEDYEGDFCGGIVGLPCPEGYTCQLDGNYPDAGGVCIKI